MPKDETSNHEMSNYFGQKKLRQMTKRWIDI